MKNDLKINRLIAELGFQPIPMEGGYFSLSYTADETIPAECLPNRYTNSRSMAGAIYLIETEEEFSAMHRLPTDEVYYYHYGDPLEMLFLNPDGSSETKILGPDVLAGHRPQILAPKYCIHGSRPITGGQFGYFFGSTSMAPGFDESDPSFPSRETLVAKYPERQQLITSLTRLKPHHA